MFMPMKSMMSTRPKIVQTYWGVTSTAVGWLLCVGDGRGGGLVVVVLFCRGESFEKDLRCGPKLWVFVDLVELDDEVDGVGVTMLKIVEALTGASFLSTSVELDTKGAGGGAGREMMNSNTSLPSRLTPERFLAVFAICFDRSDLACTCFSGRFLVQSCGRAT